MGEVSAISAVDETLIQALQQHLRSKRVSLHELLGQFCNRLAKNVPHRPRKVHLSRQLKLHSLYLNEKKRSIDGIIQDIEGGRNLSRYLSDTADQLDKIDYCLANFGVHHMHLGEIQQGGKRKDRVKCTRSLLFVKVEDDDAYLLDILDHDLRASFLSIRLMRTMLENWPELLNSYRFPVHSLEKLSDHEIAELLEGNVNCAIDLGTDVNPYQVFRLPGMGMTSAGTSLKIGTQVDNILRDLRATTSAIMQNPRAVMEIVHDIGGKSFKAIRLKARIRNGKIEIYDEISSCVFSKEDNKLTVLLSKKIAS